MKIAPFLLGIICLGVNIFIISEGYNRIDTLEGKMMLLLGFMFLTLLWIYWQHSVSKQEKRND